MECCILTGMDFRAYRVLYTDWYGVQSIWSAVYCLVWSSEHMECFILTDMGIRAYGVLYTDWYGVQSIWSAVK